MILQDLVIIRLATIGRKRLLCIEFSVGMPTARRLNTESSRRAFTRRVGSHFCGAHDDGAADGFRRMPGRWTDRGCVRMTLASRKDDSGARAATTRRGSRGHVRRMSLDGSSEVKPTEPTDPSAPDVRAAASADLHRELLAGGAVQDAAIARLHALLLKVACGEANRRRPQLPERVRDELDDLCVQAANDALMTILRKIGEFRGDPGSRRGASSSSSSRCRRACAATRGDIARAGRTATCGPDSPMHRRRRSTNSSSRNWPPRLRRR